MRLAGRAAALGFLFLTAFSLALAQSKELTETVAFSPGDTLTLKTYKGSILLSVWDRPEVSVYARITPPEGEPADYAARVVEATKVDIRKSGGTVSIRSNYDDVPSKKAWGNWFGDSKNLAFVHYDIKAPRNLKLRLEDFKSGIELYGFSGDFKIETYKGKIKASDLAGRLRLDTFKGTADLTGIRGSLDVDTHKGEVSIQSVRIEDDSRLETYKGNITLTLPANQGLDVNADLGRKGELLSDFGSLELEPGQFKKRSDRHFSRVLNNGGPRLSIQTDKGEIHIRRW